MADRLRLLRFASAVLALSVGNGSAAQTLTDPTRPPLELMSANVAGAAPRTPLQSILLSATRKGAIISGQYVPLGGFYGKAKLVDIAATEVTLKSDHGLEVLQLYSPMEKTPAASGVEGKSEKAARLP